ncbi:hypothetical protein J7E29_05675 [Streptomyces sp. ISL-90]|nr:hypothetical protein [Streptomyces sp. ISL-90]
MASITAASRAWIPTTTTAAIVVVLLLVVAQMPEVCPAVLPAPPSCAVDARESAAISAGLLVLASAAIAIAVTYALPVRARPMVLRLTMIAMALIGALALVMTVGASGFILV